MAEKKSEQKAIPRCPKSSLFLEIESGASGGRGVYYARVPADHTIDDVLSPNYFGMLIGEKGLQTHDVIDVEPESALWGVRLRVMAVVPSLQQIRTREIENFRQDYAIEPPHGYRFIWGGEMAKWKFIKGDIEVDAGFDSQDQCLGRIEELQHEKAA